MTQYVVTCMCGHRSKVPESALGTEGLCSKCGERILVSEDNTQPIDEPVRVDDPWLKGDAESCPSCGRPFRGDWDKLETPRGILCNICANIATESMPERAKPSAPEQVAPSGALDPMEAHPRAAEGKHRSFTMFGYEIDPESEGFRRGLYIAAAAVIGVTIFFVMTSGSVDVSEAPLLEMEVEEVPGWMIAAKWIWGVVRTFLNIFVALYFTLKFAEKLPHDRFVMDAINVGGVAVFFTVVVELASFCARLIAPIPIAGPIYGALLTLLPILVGIYFFIHFFDFRLFDFVRYAVLYILAGILLIVGDLAVDGVLGLFA